MHPFSILTNEQVPLQPTDEHVTVKFLITKYFIMIVHKYN